MNNLINLPSINALDIDNETVLFKFEPVAVNYSNGKACINFHRDFRNNRKGITFLQYKEEYAKNAICRCDSTEMDASNLLLIDRISRDNLVDMPENEFISRTNEPENNRIFFTNGGLEEIRSFKVQNLAHGRTLPYAFIKTAEGWNLYNILYTLTYVENHEELGLFLPVFNDFHILDFKQFDAFGMAAVKFEEGWYLLKYTDEALYMSNVPFTDVRLSGDSERFAVKFVYDLWFDYSHTACETAHCELNANPNEGGPLIKLNTYLRTNNDIKQLPWGMLAGISVHHTADDQLTFIDMKTRKRLVTGVLDRRAYKISNTCVISSATENKQYILYPEELSTTEPTMVIKVLELDMPIKYSLPAGFILSDGFTFKVIMDAGRISNLTAKKLIPVEQEFSKIFISTIFRDIIVGCINDDKLILIRDDGTLEHREDSIMPDIQLVSIDMYC